jgi:hypothetical protein
MSDLQQQAFRLAASELGMASAAWLFVRETAAVAQDAGVAALRDDLGRAWPVLDAVCAGWLAGVHAPDLALDPVLPLLNSASRVVLVGHEALWVDPLLKALPPTVRGGLVLEGDPQTQWARVLANHGERLQALSLANFQSWAGPRSVLLTFVYGATESQVFVLPAWLRTTGPDVRMQFRSLLGWRILDVPLEIYPRWLVAADVSTLTDLKG